MTIPEPAGAGTAEKIARAVDAAVGGSYEMPDGRAFWLDGPVVREIVRRAMPAIASAITASRRQAKEEDAKIAEGIALKDEQGVLARAALRDAARAIRKTINA